MFTRLIVCLDAVQARGLRITEIAFGASFHAPLKAGTYRFSAMVTPSTGPDYELRAEVELPMRLTSKASYSTETQTLTVSGRLLAVNKAASGRTVMVSTDAYILGNVVTRSDGTYVLTRKAPQPPPTVSNYVYPLYGPCAHDATAPGGCKSESLDSIQNNDIKVVRVGRVRA